ncbi:MAG: zinc ribbon domain-containing protein [Candidatus Alcyoniella australis]|nr:zinc ribbon domain-containing protein [Candidatus Alcyoniella australis]
MKELVTQCPLCRGDINFDTTECPFCGALLAPGSERGQLILKGVICRKCGEKNYSYDFCRNCQNPFLIKCPECGYGMKVHETKCPACGLSLKKFNKTRQRRAAPIFNRAKIALVGGSAAAALLVVVLMISQFVSSAPDTAQIAASRDFEAAKELDSTGDGEIDVWEFYDKTSESLISRSLDTDGDGKPDAHERYWEGGKKRRVEHDANHDGVPEQITTHDRTGLPLMTIKYADPEEGLVAERILYGPNGKMREQTKDRDGNGRVDLLMRYNVDEKRIVEAVDSAKLGFLDLWTVYNLKGEVIEVQVDSNGDGVFDKTSRYSTEGMLVWEAEDANGDGQPDKRVYFWKDGAIRWIDYDTDGDGNVDTFESYTTEGKFARKGFDTDGDLRVDTWQ